MIGIVDVGFGNLGSLMQAVYNLGYDPILVSEPERISDISHLLLPGVGAFSNAIDQLNKTGMYYSIQDFAQSGRPLLGICLGMQLLASEGVEGGYAVGLGLVPGKVIPIKSAPGLRIPHVGWNEAHQLKKHPLLRGIRDDIDFYFVHSYCFVTDNPDDRYAQTEYGENFCSIVGRENVLGVQFHPEKSQRNGLQILDNFCGWNGKC